MDPVLGGLEVSLLVSIFFSITPILPQCIPYIALKTCSTAPDSRFEMLESDRV